MASSVASSSLRTLAKSAPASGTAPDCQLRSPGGGVQPSRPVPERPVAEKLGHLRVDGLQERRDHLRRGRLPELAISAASSDPAGRERGDRRSPALALGEPARVVGVTVPLPPLRRWEGCASSERRTPCSARGQTADTGCKSFAPVAWRPPWPTPNLSSFPRGGPGQRSIAQVLRCAGRAVPSIPVLGRRGWECDARYPGLSRTALIPYPHPRYFSLCKIV